MRQERKEVSAFSLQPLAFTCAGFTLVEMLVTLALLSLIVLALMTVFNSTQKAFRASLTQTDILESGRLAMGLITSDLEAMTPSSSPVNTNSLWKYGNYADNLNTNNNFNFYTVLANYLTAPPPLMQSLTASSQLRTNLLESFFSLSRQNIGGSPTWVGTGYTVVANRPPPDTNDIYALYRFYATTNVQAALPASLYNAFMSTLTQPTNSAYWSHLVDGVVDLTVRPYDPNGLEMTNTAEYYYSGGNNTFTNQNTLFFLQSVPGVFGFYMYSNTVPASVQVELGVLEDSTLQRAEGLPNVAPAYAQTAYLSNHVGQVHLFRQRVVIRNVDQTAYQ
ncbi:MAG TPA: prepilin-type N-terminal cleavage/methylation domain-containing protein [Candidatus Limnocylindrales bacterium]|nr:prepilin-type N-terminal cleavage/methylation domain-containing protein [Candidatus Limnocylindrales bacterium]